MRLPGAAESNRVPTRPRCPSPRPSPRGCVGQRRRRMAPLRWGARDHPGAVSGENGIRQDRDALRNRHREEEFTLTAKKRPGPPLLQVEVGNNPHSTARRLGLQRRTLTADVRSLPPGHHSRHGDLSDCQARLCPASPSLRFADSPTHPCPLPPVPLSPCLLVTDSPVLRFAVSPQLPCSSAPRRSALPLCSSAPQPPCSSAPRPMLLCPHTPLLLCSRDPSSWVGAS
jgi:hypothetical protein